MPVYTKLRKAIRTKTIAAFEWTANHCRIPNFCQKYCIVQSILHKAENFHNATLKEWILQLLWFAYDSNS